MSDRPLWADGKILIAFPEGPTALSGFSYRGMGMWRVIRGSPKGRRPPTWNLTHLGSGHRVCAIKAHMARAFEIATKIAECGEWDFDSLYGYKDRDPELVAKLMAICRDHSKEVDRTPPGEGGHTAMSQEVARQIAEMRA